MTQHNLEEDLTEMRYDIPLPENIKDKVIQNVLVLLVSANVNESLATRCYLQPLDDHETIYSFNPVEKQAVYYIGKYGACPAAVRVVPYDFESHGNAETISIPTDLFFTNLSAIVSVGVACGIKGKVQLCDVLISSEVVNCDKVLNRDQIYLPRERQKTLPWLRKLFLQPATWPEDRLRTYLANNDIPVPNVMSGVILTGVPYHADNPAINDFVRNFAGEAIGIEMQRAYFVTKTTVNAIIVKAVCGFGDEKDNEMHQPTAALLAADLVYKCLNDHKASEELKGSAT